jgi:hypothetical protein
VQVEYTPAGRPRSAIAEAVATQESEAATTRVVVEYEITGTVAKLKRFQEPDQIGIDHFRLLPATTQQVECIPGVDMVERPEKTIGQALIEGHRKLHSHQGSTTSR